MLEAYKVPKEKWSGLNNADALAKVIGVEIEDRTSGKFKDFGVGPKSMEAMTELGIDQSWDNHRKEITDFADKYNVPDATLAAMIKQINDTDTLPKFSGTVTKEVKDWIKANYTQIK
jgi:hypothetical protein